MTLLQFLESKYVSVNIENQTNFSLFKQAEGMAGQNMIHAQRRFYIWVSYFKLMALFFGLKLGLVSRPLTAQELTKALVEKNEREKKEAQALADKIKTEGQKKPETLTVVPGA